MIKHTSTRIVAFAQKKLLGLLAVCLFGFGSQSPALANTPANQTAIMRQQTAAYPVLDEKHLYALGMIETGNNDWMIGGAGEISRYQLSPAVWKVYSRSSDYQNPQVSIQVARRHWLYLAAYFKEKTGRMPDDFDMYVLWNTRYGYYERRSFARHQLAPVVKERAERFVNLVHRPQY